MYSMPEPADELVKVTEKYLGFAARDYLERQAQLHLGKELDELAEDDIDDLIQWVNNTGPLIMDQSALDQLISDLKKVQY
jgi:hypothetical protein